MPHVPINAAQRNPSFSILVEYATVTHNVLPIWTAVWTMLTTVAMTTGLFPVRVCAVRWRPNPSLEVATVGVLLGAIPG